MATQDTSSAEDLFNQMHGTAASGDPMDSESSDTAVVTDADPEEGAEDPAEEASETPGQEAAEESPAEDATPAASPSADAINASDSPSGADQDMPSQMEAMMQKLQSGFGRLRAMFDDLDTREKALAAQVQSGGAQPGGEAGEDVAAENANGAYQDGGTYDQETSGIASDYGDDFVKEIQALIGKEVDRRMADHSGKVDQLSGVAQQVQQTIQEMTSALQSQHVAAIKAAHADFEKTVSSPEFRAWVEGQPDDQKQEMLRVLVKGSWPEVVQLLNGYADHADQGTQESQPNSDALDAAAGVSNGAPVRPNMGAGSSADDTPEAAFKRINNLK